MELLFFLVMLCAIFFFMIYMPTVILVKKSQKKKDDYESLLYFIALSMLFILINYLFANFYLLKSVKATEVIECNLIANMGCLFNGEITRIVEPSFIVYLMLFIQLLVGFTYVYYVVRGIGTYKEKIRRVINLILFFAVTVMSSLVICSILYQVAFVDGLKYISLLLRNSYVVLPMLYLLVLTYVNRDKIRQK